MRDRVHSLRQKIRRAVFGLKQRIGRPLTPCPDCNELISRRARRCCYCGWEGGYHTHVRPTLRHMLLRRLPALRRSSVETTPCPHCQWEMPRRARRCPLCLKEPVFLDPETQPLRRAWRHLRRQWSGRTARYVVCPTCSIQVPPWASECTGCGWEAPPRPGRLTLLRCALARMQGGVRERLQAEAVALPGEICPECQVHIPRAEKQCMICGWMPDRPATLRDAAGFLAGKLQHHGGMPSLSLCADCHVPMPPQAGMCLVCGWTRPIKNPLVRFLRRKKNRKVRKSGRSSRPCPTCYAPLPRRAGKCMACGWEKRPERYYGKTPRAALATLAVLVIGLYFVVQCFVVLAAGGHAVGPDLDQYGRDRFEHSRFTQIPPSTP